jgi:flagellin-like protein
MKRLRRFMKNTKAISPIFATLILIAIAVIAGIVVYMFTSGFIGNLTNSGATGQEKAAVQSASIGTSSTEVLAYAQYVSGGSPITINGAIVKDADGTQQIASTVAVTGGSLSTDGALKTVTITVANALTSGHSYTVTLTSSKGGSFISPAFNAP